MKPLSLNSLLFLLALSPLLHAQWEPDVRLTYHRADKNTSFNNVWCVAASGDTVHVVWQDLRNGLPHIYYKRSPDGGLTWGPDIGFADSLSTSYDPSVAASGPMVHIVWGDLREGQSEIYYKRCTDGGTTWEPEVRLTSDPSQSQHPSLAVGGSTLHLVWEDFRGPGFPAIYYKRSTNGGTAWEPDICLTNGPASSGLPSVAAFGARVHVVWYDNRDGNTEIYHKFSTDRGSTWSLDSRLTFAPGDSWFPCIAISDLDVHIVWNDWRDGNGEVYYKHSTDGGGTWRPDTNLTNNAAWSGSPSIAASGSRVHLVFSDERAGSRNTELFYKFSTDQGTCWSPDVRLTIGSYYSDNPSVAVSGPKIHVVWQDVRVGYWEVYYKRNPTGNVGIAQPSRVGIRWEGRDIKPTPNPFSAFAILPGHEAERFSLYDISGRLAGVYRGDRIGDNLPAGVYFLRGNSRNGPPVRVVKIR